MLQNEVKWNINHDIWLSSILCICQIFVLAPAVHFIKCPQLKLWPDRTCQFHQKILTHCLLYNHKLKMWYLHINIQIQKYANNVLMCDLAIVHKMYWIKKSHSDTWSCYSHLKCATKCVTADDTNHVNT